MNKRERLLIDERGFRYSAEFMVPSGCSCYFILSEISTGFFFVNFFLNLKKKQTPRRLLLSSFICFGFGWQRNKSLKESTVEDAGR